MSRPPWRVGRKLGRTLYLDEVCVGMLDDQQIAAVVVEGLGLLGAGAGGVEWHERVAAWRQRLEALRRGRSQAEARRPRAKRLTPPPERA
jgi:hypothetical protein